MDVIFSNIVQTITGGMMTDMTFVITAMVLLSLVLVGFDWIKTLFDEQLLSWSDNRADSRMGGIGGLNSMRRQAHKYKGTAEGDVYSYEYKEALDEYVEKRGRDVSDLPEITGNLGMEDHDGFVSDRSTNFNFNDEIDMDNLSVDWDYHKDKDL